ncbi:GGDEF domain-containing protein [Marinospirillum sp.]|uniref:GGDEF domain-containing protein n=1 Tax=Marinospirillum sp. TaxID=2183934 RepID=UPI003A88CE6A
MRIEFNPPLRQLGAFIYWLISLFMIGMAVQVYRSGYYEAILLPSLLTPVFAALGIWRWAMPSRLTYDPAALLALFGLMFFLLLQPTSPHESSQWQYVSFFFPFIAFYLLPNAVSLALSLILLAGLTHWRLDLDSLEATLVFISHYLLLLMIAWLYGVRHRQKTASLEQLIGQDETTGFYNQQHLYQQLQSEIARSRAMQKPLAFLLIELHQYPLLKQEFSPSSARLFLKEASRIARMNCRTGDEAYRFDEQTLLLLLPNTSMNGALVLRERLYQQLLRELSSELGPPDTSITPLVLAPGENLDQCWQRLHQSCVHSLSERV